MTTITRFAPSPTGYFHAGSYRTALFSWIFARQKGGKFILRIEDTDKERSKKEYEQNIIESLHWLGLDYDEFYRQSERTEIYKKYLQKLISSGHAFVSKESDGDSREVIRFKNPNKKVFFEDLIRGRIEFDTTELGDFVIAKNENEPIFHLVNVVDDMEMGMTHVVRGEDHISNTPRQILIYEALGAPVPKFAHIPLLLAKDRSKLSKRNGAMAISEYKKKGYLPSAIVNYLALLGWHPVEDKEILNIDEILKEFALDRVQKSGAIFDDEKLNWFNRQYLQKMSDEEFGQKARDFLPEWLDSKIWQRALAVVREKVYFFGQIKELFGPGGELAFVKSLEEYDSQKLLWKKEPDKSQSLKHLSKVKELLEGLNPDNFDSETVKNALWSYAEEAGKGNVLWPLRFAITGQEKSPDPFVSAAILGKAETAKRIDLAIKKLA